MSSKLTALTTNPSPVITDLLYVVPAAGGNQYKAAISAYSLVVGPASAVSNEVPVFSGTTGKIVKVADGPITITAGGTAQNITLTPSTTGSINLNTAGGGTRIPSTATAGLQLYNTVDQTTNYERGDIFWNSNTFIIRASAGGTGTYRTLQLGVNSLPVYQLKNGGSTTGQHAFVAVSSGNTADIHYLFSGGISTATSGTPVCMKLTPTYNQASGTAANTDLLVNRTQTAVGSGTQRLLDLQVGGVSQFSVSNTGVFTCGNTVAAAVAVASTHKVTVVIAGTTYYLLASNV